MADPVLRDALWDAHQKARELVGTREFVGERTVETDFSDRRPSIDERRALADAAYEEVYGGHQETTEDAARRYEAMQEFDRAMSSSDNSLTDSTSLWKRVDTDTAIDRQGRADEVAEWLGR
jgi:hypothetical protein